MKQRIFIAFAWSVLVIGFFTADAFAQDDGERRGFIVNWGITSLAPGQTARLNAVFIGNPDTSPPARRVRLTFNIYGLGGPDTCPGATAAACTNNLRFIRRETSVVRLKPGEGFSLNFTAGAEETFIEAAMVEVLVGEMQPCIAPSLEIREGRKTLFVHPAVKKGFNPQPDPPGSSAME